MRRCGITIRAADLPLPPSGRVTGQATARSALPMAGTTSAIDVPMSTPTTAGSSMSGTISAIDFCVKVAPFHARSGGRTNRFQARATTCRWSTNVQQRGDELRQCLFGVEDEFSVLEVQGGRSLDGDGDDRADRSGRSVQLGWRRGCAVSSFRAALPEAAIAADKWHLVALPTRWSPRSGNAPPATTGPPRHPSGSGLGPPQAAAHRRRAPLHETVAAARSDARPGQRSWSSSPTT